MFINEKKHRMIAPSHALVYFASRQLHVGWGVVWCGLFTRRTLGENRYLNMASLPFRE